MLDLYESRRIVEGVLMAAAVAWIAWYRPSWVRSFTTRWRSDAAAALHALAFVVLFLVIAGVLHRLTGWPWGSSVAAWGALALTVAAIACAPLARPLRMLLQQHVAQVPLQAQRLAHRLAEAELRSEPALAEQARVMLQRCGVDPQTDWLPITQPAYRLLTRAAELFLQLRQWEDDGRHQAFLLEARNEFDDLRQRFQRMALRSARSLNSIERVGEVRLQFVAAGGEGRNTEDTDRLLRALVNDLIADLCEDAKAFLFDASLLCARAVLARHRGAGRREEVLAAMGFKLPPQPAPHYYGALLQGLLVLVLGLSVYFVLAPRLPSKVLNQPELFLVIVLTQLGALASAIVPKLHFGFANAGLARHTPRAFVVGAGVVAVLLMLLVNLVAGSLANGWKGVGDRIGEAWYFAASPFATAACLAWLVQDHRWRRLTPSKRRLCDALVLGCASMGVTLALQLLMLLGKMGHRAPPSGAELLGTVLFAFGFGGALGWVVPHLARVQWLPAPSEPRKVTATVTLQAAHAVAD